MAKARAEVLLVGGGVLADDLARLLGSTGDYEGVTVAGPRAEERRGSVPLDLTSASAPADVLALLEEVSPDIIVYLALSAGPGSEDEAGEDAAKAEMFSSGLRQWLERGGSFKAMIVLSSTVVYGVARATPLLFTEAFDSDPDEPEPDATIARWAESVRETERVLGAAAKRGKARVCVLRAAPTLGGPVPSYIDRFLASRLLLRVAGFDPPVQTLDHRDLIDALVAAVESRPNATLNIGGRDVCPLSRLVALQGGYALPAPAWLVRRAARSSIGGARLQWRCVADVRRAKQVLAVSPRYGLEHRGNG